LLAIFRSRTQKGETNRSSDVNKNQAQRYNAKAALKVLAPDALVYEPGMSKAGVSTIPKEIQKPPYEERAVAPNVLPTAISHIPARS